ncbi:Thiol-disulfide isomerase or thioredoxin [Chitinophaga costaii]|uniref:Thiol-disulfide isomerase or thioredoxin n=1 Tax=Chitinophaga costaii TaxID=1335309 RepID=A0A1C3YRJ9_9BACT|nr:TlpA disulfide reductase family protein [Chitinophaga costaii]PUZ30073.1 TlpA family protein disulfide reductase [Chitinophaga costaii]SCB72709.1 Thiol-disulfide isomerase or thioredoxin [Chitinophaga costaii]
MIYTTKSSIVIWTILVFFLVACSQKKTYVTIQGKLIGFHKGDSVNYCKPIDGYNNSHIFETTYITNDSGEFKIVFPSDSAGFTKIQTKRGKIFILAQNGDSIHFEEQTIPYADSFATQPVTFTGSNAAMHTLYNRMNANYFYKFNYVMDLLNKKYPVGSNLYDTLLSGINKYVLPFDSLYKQKKISKYFLEIMKSDFRNVMFWHAFHNMGALEKNNLWIIPEPEKDLTRDILQHSINVDPFLLHTNWGTNLIADFVGEYNELFRNQDYPVYDTFFYKNGFEYKASAHLIPGYNKFFWADMIIFKTLQNQEYGFSFDTIFSHLKNTFSDFTYIKIIEHLHKVSRSNLNSTLTKINNNIHTIDSTGSINSLNEAIKTHFKDTAVYIDLWATWCMPCKEEFRYKNQLNNLLKEKNIKLMYISLDDTSKKSTWEQNIRYFDLEGYHILAGKNISNDISKKVYGHEIVQSIPRYLLVNKQGKFVSMNMPRPSDLVTLKNELDSLLSKN